MAEPPLLRLIVTPAAAEGAPSPAQRAWLRRGRDQPGGKLPLFDGDGGEIAAALVRGCIDRGWAEPWFGNPLKPGWLVCKLTAAGHAALRDGPSDDGGDEKGAASGRPSPRPER